MAVFSNVFTADGATTATMTGTEDLGAPSGATFTVNTSAVSASTAATITAAHNGVTKFE